LAVALLPPELAVGGPRHVVLDAKPVAYRFAAFVLSEVGQAILKEHGFDPVALVEPTSTALGVLIQRAGAPSRTISPERIAELPRLTQRVGFVTGRGEQQNEWTGPLLWDVLVDSGAVDPAKPTDQVHLAVRVTGADGYVAVIALAEIALHRRPTIKSPTMNGAPAPRSRAASDRSGDRRRQGPIGAPTSRLRQISIEAPARAAHPPSHRNS
jgi:hypothetical protein